MKATEMRFFNELISGIFDRSWMGKSGDRKIEELTTEDLLSAAMTTEGDVSAHVYASQLIQRFEAMDDDKQMMFFNQILDLGFDVDALISAAKTYKASPNAAHLSDISRTADPKWQKLFQLFNSVPNGTIGLVHFRQKLLKAIKTNPDLGRLDIALISELRSWFNSGFLRLKPIDWTTSAIVLEKIIAYEAVHEISSWDALRARLAPEDRRCFAFFHPAMPDEPLIFVEVALMNDTPSAIADVLVTPRETVDQDVANTAVFYSISNCQQGLAGISFGNFLIKQVARNLQLNLPNLTRFVTLSPVPGFRKWLQHKHTDLTTKFEDAMNIDQTGQADANQADEALKAELCAAAGEYFLTTERPDGKPNDPVARFHLGNGASLDRINPFGDKGANGIKHSFGLMVNYLYELDVVEKNHEDYSQHNAVCASQDVKELHSPGVEK